MEAKQGDIVPRILTLYGTVREKIVNQAVMDWVEYRDSGRTLKDRGKLARNWTFLTVFGALAVAFVGELWRRARGKRGARLRSGEREGFGAAVLRNAISRQLQLVYGIGDVVGPLVDASIRLWTDHVNYQPYSQENPLSSAAAKTISAAVRSQAGVRAKMQGDDEAASRLFRKAMDDTMYGTAPLTGLPTAAGKDLIDFSGTLYDLARKAAGNPPAYHTENGPRIQGAPTTKDYQATTTKRNSIRRYQAGGK